MFAYTGINYYNVTHTRYIRGEGIGDGNVLDVELER